METAPPSSPRPLRPGKGTSDADWLATMLGRAAGAALVLALFLLVLRTFTRHSIVARLDDAETVFAAFCEADPVTEPAQPAQNDEGARDE